MLPAPVPGLTSIRSLVVTCDLDFQQVERGARAGLEQRVEDIRALRLWVALQEGGRRATARQAANAVKTAPWGVRQTQGLAQLDNSSLCMMTSCFARYLENHSVPA